MGLFQKTVEQKYLKLIDNQLLTERYAKFKSHFHNPQIQENIRNSKEEQYQGEFLIDLFVKILGYTKNPSPDFNLTTEYKNIKDSKKADGAIIIGQMVKAVIELKGTDTTDLGKVETQAFGYKNNQPDCSYIIISNFEKLRLYIDNAINYEEFDLFRLTRERFDLLYLCLCLESVAKDIPRNLKEESISREDQITKELYRDYSVFKKALYQNLVELNPQFDSLTLFKKSQKLIDRFLFLFFGEDRQLLPPNSVRLVLSQWKKLQELDEEIPLYNRFKKYFGYLNTGKKGERFDVFAYNGGLFKPDELLDRVVIDDELLYNHTYRLSTYDYASEVDVNILGHIFENSLNELDELKARQEGVEIDKSKTKRKKDGVFYTPKYITKYIVENTVGKLCEERKAELQIVEEDYVTTKGLKNLQKAAKEKEKERVGNLISKLKQYREWLVQLTICDPACGSGAFLNQALDFLINEHRYIDELEAKVYGVPMILSDIEKSILENNLFGVDLNEESVEIAKLSLWLRTAQPNRKLNDLNNNIKCGNSLIDDPAVAGDKAFNWQQEFPHIFEKGGFDVVIGNPPYGILIDKEMQNYFNAHFPMTRYKINLYVLFIERMFQILNKGTIHFIIPKSLLFNTYYEEIRKYLVTKTHLNEIFTITEKVFEDAEVGSSLLLKFSINSNFTSTNFVRLASAEKIQDFINGMNIVENIVSQSVFLDVPNCEISINSSDNQSIINKIIRYKPLNTFYILKNGLNPGNIKHILITDEKLSDNHKQIIWGKDISKYFVSWSGQYINYDESIGERINLDDIKSKEGMNKQNKIDFALRSKELFETRKIIIRKTGDSLIACIDEDKLYFDTLVHGIYEQVNNYNLEFLVTILNSKPATIFYRLLHDIKGKVFAKISLDSLSSFPIPDCELEDINKISEKGRLLTLQRKELQVISQRFQRTLQRKFNLEDLPGKLQNWHLITYKELIAELGKKKVKLSLSEEAEWEDYFLQESAKAHAIKARIDATDKEIDRMVYELYGLTEEEREMVEKIK